MMFARRSYRYRVQRSVLIAVAAILPVACGPDSTLPTAESTRDVPERLIAITVDLRSGTAWQAAAGLSTSRGAAFALLGSNEISATVTNLTTAPAVGNRNQVRFDLTLTNQFANSSLVPSTFPPPPVAEVVAFPFSTDPVGRITASSDWDGAAFNFFNDASCAGPAATSDCFPWEGFGVSLAAGASETRKVGFLVEPSITSFTAYIVVAADVEEGPPPPLPFPPGTIFAAASTGVDDIAGGDVLNPVKSIGFAMQLAIDRGVNTIAAAAGLYQGSIALAPGISLLGGYNAGFSERDPETYASIIRVAPGEAAVSTVACTNIPSAPTLLEGFVIFGPDPTTPGTSTQAIHVTECFSNLTIRMNTIFGGRGADGATGVRGSDGHPGGAGAAGLDALVFSPNGPAPQRFGGAGGNVPGAGGAGGPGGDGAEPTYDVAVGAGVAGIGNGGGPGGAGGYSGIWTSGVVLLPTNGNFGGAAGADGVSGSNGIPGAGGGAGGSIDVNVWLGASGSNGSDGQNGAGGGGGGASGGIEDDDIAVAPDPVVGATGGGGGQGGGGGTGGAGGGGGGGSFGIFLSYSSAPPTLPVITGNTLYLGRGGNGGYGGQAGIGAAGGVGGAGGGSAGTFTVPAGNGGAGGNGGHGGGGGGGGGGLSAGIAATLFGVGAPAWGSLNQITLTTGSGGAGGLGGASFGAVGTNGSAGQLTPVRVF